MPSKRENRKCPPEFQARLTRAGGINRYGEPNFIIVWGQSWTVRRGSYWQDESGKYFKGYRDILEDGRPCWILKQWKPPEVFGNPRIWFWENQDNAIVNEKDTRTLDALRNSRSYGAGLMREITEEAVNVTRNEATQLQLLGDFPWKGMYETVQPFIWRGLVNNRMVVEHMPLNSMILDLVIPIIIKCQDATMEQKRIAIADMKRRKNQAEVNDIEQRRHDARMAFTGPVSYARQGCKTSLVDRKVYEMQKHWNSAMSTIRRQGLGTSIA